MKKGTATKLVKIKFKTDCHKNSHRGYTPVEFYMIMFHMEDDSIGDDNNIVEKAMLDEKANSNVTSKN